jgi:septal ring-binding cell division protein DamX
MLKNLKLLNYCTQFLTIIAIFVVFSCNKNQSSQLRFVNLAGKSKPIKFRVPEENAQILGNAKQNTLQSNKNNANLDKSLNQNLAQNSVQNISPTNQALVENANPALKPENTPQNKLDSNQSSSANTNVQYSDNQQQSVKNIAEQKYDFAENVASSLSPKPASVNNQVPEEEMIIKGNYTNETKNIKEKEKISDKFKKNLQKSQEKQPLAIKNYNEKKFYLQLASFNNQENAVDFSQKSKHKNIEVIEANLGDKTVYRAVVGPYQTRLMASKEMQKIKKSGQEAVIIKH